MFMFNFQKAGIILIIVLLIISNNPRTFGNTYSRSYNSSNQFGLNNHELHISAPLSLYNYYQGKNHAIRYDNDYSDFVTPNAFESIAKDLRRLTRNKRHADEEFANAVMTIVHQIPYAPTDVKYPIETIVDNSGDCDTIALLAASIMKAGGLDVVLLYYKSEVHMNLGVSLPYEPYHTWMWSSPTYFEYNGKKYWTAECTSEREWKIGDQPPTLVYASPTVIPLENCEEKSPAQISAKLDNPLNQSLISVNLSSKHSNIENQQTTITVSGSILPKLSEENIAIYTSKDKKTYEVFQTKTDTTGKYYFNWNTTSTGTHFIKSSWSGAQNQTAVDSKLLTIFIGFPKPIHQYEINNDQYFIGRPSIAMYELRRIKGVDEFLNVDLMGRGVKLKGQFTVMSNGETQQEQQLLSKRDSVVKLLPRGTSITLAVTEQKIVLPQNLPGDLQPLPIPEGFVVNDQFGFILQNNATNHYNVEVRGMNKDDIIQMEENDSTILSLSEVIEQNIWYNFTAKMSTNETTVTLDGLDNIIIENQIAKNETNINELTIILANNKDKVIAFKDLKIELLREENQSSKGMEQTKPYGHLFFEVVFVWITVLASIIYIKKFRSVE